MSWLDKIKNNIIITTGDGSSYSPNWINASKDIEWNISEFKFPGQPGSLINRKKKLGTRYNLELYFQGEDHLDDSSALEASLNKDEKAIKIEHPYYGVLYVQAQSFNIDNSQHNVSKWTGKVIETILDINPKTSVDIVDSIAIKKEQMDSDAATALTDTPSVTDVTDVNQKNLDIFNSTIPVLEIPDEVESYFNIFNSANSAVNNLVTSPLVAMQLTIAMINAPATFTVNLKSKLNLLEGYLDTLSANIGNITTPASKQIYVSSGASVISSMAIVAINPGESDYTTAKSVYKVIDSIIASYSSFITSVSTLHTSSGGSPSSFIPSHSVMSGLEQIINLSLANLFSIALNSRNERTYITPEDTNIILLAHKFYGLDVNDANINEFISQNQFGLNGILQIRKGTTVYYYK